MMTYVPLPSFERSLKQLQEQERLLVVRALKKFNESAMTGMISGGLGIKKLREEQYELRIGLKLRVLFQREREKIYLIVVGNHDDIRRYLKHYKM